LIVFIDNFIQKYTIWCFSRNYEVYNFLFKFTFKLYGECAIYICFTVTFVAVLANDLSNCKPHLLCFITKVKYNGVHWVTCWADGIHTRVVLLPHNPFIYCIYMFK